MKFEQFLNPGSRFRPTPFWAINDRLTPEETSRQFSDMLDKGMGGGFFHSRVGLISEYIGDEWIACMNAVLKVAEEKNGLLWLYDEDLWPSGNAGGQVAAMGEQYRATQIKAYLLQEGETLKQLPETNILKIYRILKRTWDTVEEYEVCNTTDISKVSGERVVIRNEIAPKIGWWSGESYSNLLNPNVTKEFIQLTHERYKKHFAKYFGNLIPGIFTDEPQLHSNVASLPWYDGLPAIYQKAVGRDFWNDLIYVFFEGPKMRTIRQSVNRVILHQFVHAYSKPIFEWCEANKLSHTGHYNAEDTLLSQLCYHAGGIMAHYRYQQNPGIDQLCRQIDGAFLALKQVSSAVRQLGREPALNEIFGVSHHTNTFEDFRWLGDYSLVQGATFFCPHLSLYTMTGARKRDYPPNWNYQQTYWNDLKPLNDYFGRLGAILSSGKSHAEILVLHPIEDSMASLPRQFEIPEVGTMNRSIDRGESTGYVNWQNEMLFRVMSGVQDAGRDFDLGDEGYIADLGRVENGKFIIGEQQYSTVILPPATTWRPNTYMLLEKFVGQGGTVILTGEIPRELDCKPAAERWSALLTNKNVHAVACGAAAIIQKLWQAHSSDYALTLSTGAPAAGIKLHRRKDAGMQYFFMVNTNRAASMKLRMSVTNKKTLPIARWDAMTGECITIDTKKAGNESVLEFELGPTSSILLAHGKDAVTKTAKREKTYSSVVKTMPLTDSWDYALSEENVLVLDRISYSIDNGITWSKEDLDHRIRRELAGHFGVRESLEWQPWVSIRKKLFDKKGGKVILKYNFSSSLEKIKSASIVIEQVSDGSLAVNGKAIKNVGAAWHWDRNFGRTDIASYIKKGDNEVLYSIDYNFLSLVEPAYVVGNFGVSMKDPLRGEICELPKRIKNGSWLTQKLPFYSGKMTYKASVKMVKGKKRFMLRLLNPSCILAGVRVNGSDTSTMNWRPFEVEVTDLLKNGSNSIEIDIILSRQNSHGPLHVKEGDDYAWFGPNAFEDDGQLREEFSLFDYGLLGGAEIVEVI